MGVLVCNKLNHAGMLQRVLGLSAQHSPRINLDTPYHISEEWK